MADDMKEYYARRAAIYEQIYEIPERQGDLATLRRMLPELLAGHDILEVACGTGYWTLPISSTARSILATDVNTEVLDLARTKPYPPERVRFMLADAYTLPGVEGEFTAGFAGFWWSHVPKSRLRGFLDTFHGKLLPGSLVVFTDNTRQGTRHSISRRDEEGNTYQVRRLPDGRDYEVLKNFPDRADIHACLDGIARELRFVVLTYYWCLSYRVEG